MSHTRVTAFLFLIGFGASAVAQAPEAGKDRFGLNVDSLRSLAVLSDKRFKPFDSYARELITAVCGDESPKRLTADGKEKRIDPLVLYLQWIFEPARERTIKQIVADKESVRRQVTPGRDEKDTLYSYDELAANPVLKQMVARLREHGEGEMSKFDQEVGLLNRRVNEFAYNAGISSDWGAMPEDLRAGAPIIPSADARRPGIEYTWMPVAALSQSAFPVEKTAPVLAAWKSLRTAFLASDQAGFDAAAGSLRQAIIGLGAPEYPAADRLEREVRYFRIQPINVARACFLAAFFIGVVWLFLKSRVIGALAWLTALTGVGFHTFGSIERTALSGQALIGNLFESLVFTAGAAVVVSLAFEAKFRSRWFLVAGTLLGSVALSVALQYPLLLSPGIAQLRPVLINNFWIHIHVPTMMASYATLFLATLMAHVWLFMSLFRKSEHPAMKSVAKYTYWILPPGVILLFAGIILGGIWADASWGRFWGWDPKENAALATWIVFVLVIHGRWAGWLRDFGTAMGCIGGGAAIMWTYYGVNFLKKGLHSYAGASTDAAEMSWLAIPKPLLAYVGFELLIMAAATTVYVVRWKGEPLPASTDDGPNEADAAASHGKPALRG